MERRHSAALSRPSTPPIRPLPIRPAVGTYASKPSTPTPHHVRFSPSPSRAPSPTLSRSSPAAPARPLSRIGSTPAPPRPALARLSTYTSSTTGVRPPTPARSTTYPPTPLARLSTPINPWRPPSGAPRPPLHRQPTNTWDLRRPTTHPALNRPSSLYTSRRTGLATPPPSRPVSGTSSNGRPASSSSSSFQPVPAHLAFIDPSIPPAPGAGAHPEGTVLARSNLFVARGKPRLGVAYWEYVAVTRAQQVLEAYVPEVRDRCAAARQGGRKAVEAMRDETYMATRCVVEVAIAVLRMIKGSEEGMRINAEVASRLIHIRWGDDNEWRRIWALHNDRGIEPSAKSQRDARAVRGYTELTVDVFADRPALSHLTLSLHKSIVHLLASWDLELKLPLSIELRRHAQNGADRSAWTELQWRSEAFKGGMRATSEGARRLARETARFLDGVRGRGGLDGDKYLLLFQRLQTYAPHGFDLEPRKEYCPR
ncbi:hypothetical protein JCM8208_002380 [Rhodotorula glutinis]